jgi:hypothetical protein
MRSRSLRIDACAVLLALAGAASAEPAAPSAAQLSALVIDPVVSEISGMATSPGRRPFLVVPNQNHQSHAQ